MKYLLITAIFAITLISCSKEDVQPAPAMGVDNEVKLDNPAPGQNSAYLRYEATCGSSDFAYTGDTLMLSVSEDNGQIFFEEHFTAGSPILLESLPTPFPEIKYPVIFENNYLLLRERQGSMIFFFYGNDTIFTKREPQIDLNQGTCFLENPDDTPFIGELIGRLPLFNFGDFIIRDSRVVSCVPSFMEMDAYLFFDDSGLKLSQSLLPAFEVRAIIGYRRISMK